MVFFLEWSSGWDNRFFTQQIDIVGLSVLNGGLTLKVNMCYSDAASELSRKFFFLLFILTMDFTRTLCFILDCLFWFPCLFWEWDRSQGFRFGRIGGCCLITRGHVMGCPSYVSLVVCECLRFSDSFFDVFNESFRCCVLIQYSVPFVCIKRHWRLVIRSCRSCARGRHQNVSLNFRSALFYT